MKLYILNKDYSLSSMEAIISQLEKLSDEKKPTICSLDIYPDYNEEHAIACLQREYILFRKDGDKYFIGSNGFETCVAVVIKNEGGDYIFAHVDASADIDFRAMLLEKLGGESFEIQIICHALKDKFQGVAVTNIKRFFEQMLSGLAEFNVVCSVTHADLFPVDCCDGKENLAFDCRTGVFLSSTQERFPTVKERLQQREARLLDSHYSHPEYGDSCLLLARDLARGETQSFDLSELLIERAVNCISNDYGKIQAGMAAIFGQEATFENCNFLKRFIHCLSPIWDIWFAKERPKAKKDLGSLREKAVTLFQTKQYEDACNHFDQFIKKLTQEVCVAHIDVATAHYNMGSCLVHLGKNFEAFLEYRTCLIMRLEIFEEDAPEVIKVQKKIAEMNFTPPVLSLGCR